MKIEKFSNVQINKIQSKSPVFSGMIPQKYILELQKQNTIEAKKILDSVLAYNAVWRGAQNVNPDKIAKELMDKFKIKVEFGNNPLFASYTALAVNIFHKLGYPKPPGILLKDLRGLSYKNYIGMCAVHPKNDEIYRRFGKDFPVGTVIMNSAKNWGDTNINLNIQEEMIELYKQKHSSTCHFLSPFIHEFFHNLHIKNLQKRFKNSSKIMWKLQKDFQNKDTITFIKKETGKYGATKPCELFAEEMTELVVNSLNPKNLLPNEMIFRIERCKEPILMDKLIDACWNGDTKFLENLCKKDNIFKQLIKKIKKD